MILGIFSSLMMFTNNKLYKKQQKEAVIINNSQHKFYAIQDTYSGSISAINTTFYNLIK